MSVASDWSWIVWILSLGCDLCPSPACPWLAFCDPQHTPVILASILVRINIHDFVAEGSKLDALEGFGEVVRQHGLGWTVFNADFTIGHPIRHKEIPHINVTRSFATRSSPVLFQ
jgi:hypothetical protein